MTLELLAAILASIALLLVLRLWNSTRVQLDAALSIFKMQRERIDRLEAAIGALMERSAKDQ